MNRCVVLNCSLKPSWGFRTQVQSADLRWRHGWQLERNTGLLGINVSMVECYIGKLANQRAMLNLLLTTKWWVWCGHCVNSPDIEGESPQKQSPECRVQLYTCVFSTDFIIWWIVVILGLTNLRNTFFKPQLYLNCDFRKWFAIIYWFLLIVSSSLKTQWTS